MDSVRPNSTSDLSASPTQTTATAASEPALPKARCGPGYFRWVICGLLLLGTTKNYMDRWVLSALKTTLQHDLGWSEIDYSHIVIAFQAAYAVGMLPVGGFIDRVGTRLGYAMVMIFWSFASWRTPQEARSRVSSWRGS